MAFNGILDLTGKSLPAPSVYKWAEQDVSAKGAGRVEDGTMYKYSLGASATVEVAWNGITTAQASTILGLFDQEYINVYYLDLKTGVETEREFYVGDRTAPMYNASLGLWDNLGFKLIERGVH